MSPVTKKNPLNSTPTQPSPHFDVALDTAFQGIRGALTELLTSLNSDASKPQEISRRFNINKNVAWRISKIISTTDPHLVIPHLPGPAAMNRVYKAFEKHGASKVKINAVRSAIIRFEETVELHVDDRSTLELVLTANAPHKVSPEHLHATRRLAFQGNSAIWGIQARVRLAAFFLAPAPNDPTMLDTASLGGLIDVRRLRTDASVPFFMRFAYNDDGSPRAVDEREPISSDKTEHDPLMLVHEFCSQPVPTFDIISDHSLTRYHLAPGPIGNEGLSTWIYGEVIRKFASIYHDDYNEVGEHAIPIQLPVERCLCDLIIHKDLKFAMTPQAMVYSQLNLGPAPSPNAACDKLPISEHIVNIGQEPPIVSTPLIPRYPEMVDCVYQRMHWNAADFCGFRFVMKYPPMPTAIVIQHGLA